MNLTLFFQFHGTFARFIMCSNRIFSSIQGKMLGMKCKENNSTENEDKETCELELYRVQTSKVLVTHNITGSNKCKINIVLRSPVPDVGALDVPEEANCSLSRFHII